MDGGGGEGEEWGWVKREKRCVYVELGSDHFRHVFNYFEAAVELASGGFLMGMI